MRGRRGPREGSHMAAVSWARHRRLVRAEAGAGKFKPLSFLWAPSD